MPRLLVLFACLCAVVGCHVISPEHLKGPRPKAEEVQATPTSKSVELPDSKLPDAKDDPLLLAADCLAEQNFQGAIKHLTQHVEKNPDQLVFRMQLAELLLKEMRLSEAHEQFHEVCVHAQSGNASAKKQLVHAHTRLMEIAQERGDKYAEQLHRGIGLYRVAEQLQLKADGIEPHEIERLLFKAVAAFKNADEARPNDARTAWYMHLAWTHLDQPRPAEKYLRKAQANAAFSPLTPAESQELALFGLK